MPKSDNRPYKLLFQAKLWALFAAGVATVELSVIAYNVAGNDSAALLGTALSLKSLAYVAVPLLTAAIFERLPRGRFLMALDILRALSLLSLVFVTGEATFLAAIAVFLTASAAFKITYLEYVSHLLPDRGEFAWAMSKSRIVDELEGVASPLAAALLLFLLPVDSLLLLSAAVFAVSALRIKAADLPDLSGKGGGRRARQALSGLRMFFARAELRPLTWLMVAVAAGTAMVMTSTPYLIRSIAGEGPSATAIAFGAFGAGAILGALVHVRLRAPLSCGSEMAAGGVLIAAGLLAGMAVTTFAGFLALWAAIGAGISLVQMPAAEIIRDAGGSGGMMAAFGAGLAMQNAILAGAYMLAGWLAAGAGPETAFAVTGGGAAIAVALAWAGLRPSASAGSLRPKR
ncbi:hypothetical protein [Mangrovicoccus sp. HB161399]|uniref:hypothetical protein n=1 Tax=Mangrovicoccus sp. HB161399 TaxID=2720392 RepID=UPI0015547010|nr:hypothetical protein [Mangrovicoccus sp. HB161399]